MEDIPAVGETLTLEGDEAHHMLNVIRVRTGEDVLLIDGSGREAVARLTGGRRKQATLDILRVDHVDREPARRLTLGCALPRSTRMDWLVEKCCELGVARLVPIMTERSVVDPISRQKNHQRRWLRTTIEAAKQSGRTRLTEITPVLPFHAVFDQKPDDAVRILASLEPDAVSLGQFMGELSATQPVFALVGPEGGFTPDEVASARNMGFRPVSLGPRVLRVETAVLALAACLLLSD